MDTKGPLGCPLSCAAHRLWEDRDCLIETCAGAQSPASPSHGNEAPTLSEAPEHRANTRSSPGPELAAKTSEHSSPRTRQAAGGDAVTPQNQADQGAQTFWGKQRVRTCVRCGPRGLPLALPPGPHPYSWSLSVERRSARPRRWETPTPTACLFCVLPKLDASFPQVDDVSLDPEHRQCDPPSEMGYLCPSPAVPKPHP